MKRTVKKKQPKKKKNSKSPGRPPKMTAETLGLLREAFLMGCTDEEACVNANIHPATLYEYQTKFPKYTEEKECYKSNPTLKARKTLYDNLTNIDEAKWFLTRKRKDEFESNALPDTGEGKVMGIIYTAPGGLENGQTNHN